MDTEQTAEPSAEPARPSDDLDARWQAVKKHASDEVRVASEAAEAAAALLSLAEQSLRLAKQRERCLALGCNPAIVAAYIAGEDPCMVTAGR